MFGGSHVSYSLKGGKRFSAPLRILDALNAKYSAVPTAKWPTELAQARTLDDLPQDELTTMSIVGEEVSANSRLRPTLLGKTTILHCLSSAIPSRERGGHLHVDGT